MALAQEDIEQIQDLIKKVMAQAPEAVNANVRYELDVRERVIRVEEELKHQRELMSEGFRQMEKRFEQVDKRFEQQHQEIMGLHQEIRQLIRWSFGTLLAIGGLIVAVLRLVA
jgi:Flp pilus assembly protein TadB